MRSASDAVARVLAVLDRMEIPYAVGGSAASSAHGMPRTTLDLDIVVDFKPEQIDDFAAELADEFYVDAETMRDAFARGRSVNLIHFASAWKFDLFPLKQDAYSRVEFGRRAFREIRPDGSAAIECAVASREDTVLRKLEWYRAGGESSERQWNDVRGVCRAAGVALDVAYLRRWAGHLNVADLLEKLLAEFKL